MVEEEKQMGRPSLFDQEMIEKTKEYVMFFQLPQEDRLALRESRINPVEEIPSVAGLALYLGVSKRVIYNWRDKNEDFMHTLEALQDTQEVLLLNNGLTGKFTAPISKLALANHGYSDKQEVDNKSSDGSMTPKSTMTHEQVKEIVQELKEEI